MKVNSQLDYQTVLAHQARPVHVVLRLQAESVHTPRPQPAAFCLVLDRSGSMAGPPLAHARDAAKLAVRNLRPTDHFALVVFDDEAQTLIPLQPATAKERILREIDALTDGGSTNLTGGWTLGRDALRQAPPGAKRRLLLLTDGQLNHGIVEPLAVRQIVTGGLERDAITTSSLGFGADYNEDLLAELARATNGQFYDADSPEKFPAIFAAELDGLQRLAVQNLRLRVRGLDFCDAFASLGEYPVVKLPDGRLEFTVGDLVSDEERVLCFAVKVLPLPCIEGKPAFSLEGEPLLEFELVYDELGAQELASRTWTQTVRIQATQDPGQVRLNGEVVAWVAMQKAGAVLNEVTRKMDQGQGPEALAHLDRAVSELRSYGPGDQVGEALAALEPLRERIEDGAWDARTRKSSRYASQYLCKMSSAAHWSGQGPAPKRRPSAHPTPSPQPPTAPTSGSVSPEPPTPPPPASTPPSP